MARYVQKFGGSSLATVALIQAAAAKVAALVQASHQVVVVVSAMQGDTDRLLSLANNLDPIKSSREVSALLATAEQASAALFALALQSLGVPSQSLCGFQAGLHTSLQYQKSDILSVSSEKLLTSLSQCTPVVTGFQGINANDELTTLGRGGSDLSAVAIAHAIQADECQIFTDVPGVFTSDPRVVAQARVMTRVTYPEMLTLTKLGTKVLQLRAVEYGSRYGVPIRVLSSFVTGDGTLIHAAELTNSQSNRVVGLGIQEDQSSFVISGVSQLDNFISKLVTELGHQHIDIDMLMHHQSHDAHDQYNVKFLVNDEDYLHTRHLLKQIVKQTPYRLNSENHRTKLSLVGQGVTCHTQMAAKLMAQLSQAHIKWDLLSARGCSVSVVIAHDHLTQAAERLHQVFIDKDVATIL